MHSAFHQLAEPALSNAASTPTIPPPEPQPLSQYLTSTPPPPHSKKRSSNDAGNHDVEIRIRNPQDDLTAIYFPYTTLAPSDRPSKKIKISPESQVNNTPSVAPLLWKPQQKQPYQQSFQLSARQRDILQHLPPSQLLLNTTAYLSEQEPLLAPLARAGDKRVWDDAAMDEAWGFDDLGGPMSKKSRVGKGR